MLCVSVFGNTSYIFVWYLLYPHFFCKLYGKAHLFLIAVEFNTSGQSCSRELRSVRPFTGVQYARKDTKGKNAIEDSYFYERKIRNHALTAAKEWLHSLGNFWIHCLQPPRQIFWEYCAVFTLCKNCWATEIGKHGDYATISKAVFPACRAELHRALGLATVRPLT